YLLPPQSPQIARRPGPLGPERQAAHEKLKSLLWVPSDWRSRCRRACREFLRRGMPVAAARVVTVQRNVFVLRNRVRGDWPGGGRRIEDPPVTAIIPQDPRMADLARPSRLADYIAHIVPVTDLVGDPEALRLAVARARPSRCIRQLGGIGFREAVAERAAFAH